MQMSRRAFLAGLPVFGGGDPAPFMLSAGGDAVMLPGLRARLMFSARLEGRPLLVAQFGVSCVRGTLDLLVLCGGAPFRLRGLELLRYQLADSLDIATRPSITADGSSVVLVRESARKLAPTRWARESWTDTLGWRDGGLAEQTVRTPADGSIQAFLAAARARISPLLSPAPPFVPDAAIRVQADTLSLVVSAQPSMRQEPSGCFSIV